MIFGPNANYAEEKNSGPLITCNVARLAYQRQLQVSDAPRKQHHAVTSSQHKNIHVSGAWMCRNTKTFGSNELIKYSLENRERNRKYKQKNKNMIQANKNMIQANKNNIHTYIYRAVRQ